MQEDHSESEDDRDTFYGDSSTDEDEEDDANNNNEDDEEGEDLTGDRDARSAALIFAEQKTTLAAYTDLPGNLYFRYYN